MGQRWAAGQKAVGPTSAAIVGPTDVPTLARRQHAIWDRDWCSIFQYRSIIPQNCQYRHLLLVFQYRNNIHQTDKKILKCLFYSINVFLLHKIFKKTQFQQIQNGVKSAAIFVYIVSDLLPVSRKRASTQESIKDLFYVTFVTFLYIFYCSNVFLVDK